MLRVVNFICLPSKWHWVAPWVAFYTELGETQWNALEAYKALYNEDYRGEQRFGMLRYEPLSFQGKCNKLICRELKLAEGTVKIHVTAILKTLNVANRTQAVIAVGKLGLQLPQPG